MNLRVSPIGPTVRQVATESEKRKYARGTDGGEILLHGVNGVPDEWECAPRLAAMLRSECEEDNTAFALRNFGERYLIFNLVFAAKPTGAQDCVFRITRDDVNLVSIRRLKGRTVDEESVGLVRRRARDWSRCVNGNTQD